MTTNGQETMVEKARREVDEQIAKSAASRDRAMAAKYNLLRVSERRWRIVRISSVAEMMFGVRDVITFECVTEPLPYDDALAQLRERRGTTTTTTTTKETTR